MMIARRLQSDHPSSSPNGSFAAGILAAVIRCHSLIRPSLLPHLIMTHLLNPQTALRLTYLIERLMFPLDGYPAPSPIEPMPAEARDLRVRMDARVGEVLPGEFARRLGLVIPQTR